MGKRMASLLERIRKALSPKYTLEREIASGGMGVVFLGVNTRLRSRVAIKVLRPELATAAMEARFLREARLLAQLSHPNIVTVHDVDVADGVHYYVMDYIEGETLSQRLERGPLDPAEVLSLGQDLLSALETVHKLNVVHRDIKPSNIFLVDGRALLVDFGIAHVDHTESDATQTGQRIGTPAYMPPEQRFASFVTSQTDLYALGMVLYECSTGTKWQQTDDSEQRSWESVPQPLAKALRKALKTNPNERWADAASFRAALMPTRHFQFPKASVLVAGFVTLGILIALIWPRSPGLVDLAISDFEVVGTTPETGIALAGLVRRRLDPIPQLTLDADGNAEHTIARLFLTGTLAREAGGWILSGTYVDSAHGSHAFRFGIDGDSPNALADSLALDIVRLYFEAFRDRIVLPSRNIEALGEWFRGEIAFQKDMWYQAERHFGDALRHDPEFALAAWRRYNARQWGRRLTRIDLDSLYRETLENKDALSQLDRLLIRAELQPDLETRLLIYDSAVTFNPRDYYAALQRGNELFHRGPLVGRGLQEGLAALRKAQRIDSLLAPAYNQSLWAAIRLGLQPVARGLLEKRNSIPTPVSSEDIDAGMLFSWAFLERFYPELAIGMRQDVMRNPTSDTATQVAKLFRLAPSLDIPNTAVDLGQWIAGELVFDFDEQANGRLGVGLASIMVGQPLAGLDHIDAALAPTNDAELLAEEARLLLPLFAIPIPEDQRERARNALILLSKDRRWGQRPAWALAVDALYRGGEAAREYTRWRRELAGTPAPDVYRLSLYEVLKVLELGLIDPRRAVARSRQLTAVDSAGRGTDPFARALLYWHRARWLEDLDEWDQAERTWLWYENSDFGAYPAGRVQAAEIDWIIGSYARLQRAKVQLRWPNRTADACRHLRRVVELWANAESSILPLRQEADSLIADRCAA
jgi:serine/threonine protein kinase